MPYAIGVRSGDFVEIGSPGDMKIGDIELYDLEFTASPYGVATLSSASKAKLWSRYFRELEQGFRSDYPPKYKPSFSRQTYEDENWMDRERRRFELRDNQRYIPVPWVDEEWWRIMMRLRDIRLGFPHLSLKDPGKIAYTPDNEKGRKDIQVYCTPGRYLQKFFGHILSPKEIQQWATSTDITPEHVIEFTQDPKLIRDMYVNGPRSCMSHPECDFDTNGVHPTIAYSKGDLWLAFMRSPKDPNRCMGRTIVWPEKKLYSRVYGDLIRMALRLDEAGYQPGEMTDAKIGRIPLFDCENRVIIPYVDGNVQFGTAVGELIQIGGAGGVELKRTNGYSYVYEIRPCGHCHSPTHSDRLLPVDDQEWCSHCSAYYSYFCEHHDGRTRHETHYVIVTGPRGGNRDYQNWCLPCIERDTFRSESGEWWANASGVRTFDDRLISYDDLRRSYFRCNDCRQIFPNTQRQEIRHDHRTLNLCPTCNTAREARHTANIAKRSNRETVQA